MCAWCLQRPEEDARFPEMRVADDLEPPCGSWKRNYDPL